MSVARAAANLPAVAVGCWRRALLAMAISGVLVGWAGAALASETADATAAAPADAGAVEVEFDRSLLSGAGQNTDDLTRFERGNPVLPGTYRADIYLNDVWVARRDVRFAAPAPNTSASACISPELLADLTLPTAKMPPEVLAKLAVPGSCVDIATLIPAATAVFDQSELRLDVSVPQAWLGHAPRGYVSPQYWDSGVTAALLNYNFNGYHTRSGGLSQTSAYLGFNAGLNIGRWHLRHDSALNWQSSSGPTPSRRQWQSIDTYARRDVPALHAQLTLGDSFTGGELFDSVGLRGVQLATDDRMLPDSLRGYAPTVRGVATSNARVTVRQNGIVIYETTVSPGPFMIDDLYPTGYGGDLQVSVAEADGRVQTFAVSYAAVPQLLRPGVTRFSAAAGQLRDQSVRDQPLIVQATVQRGFNNLLTGYTGAVGASGYAAALLGSAWNTRFGALAADITTARTSIPGATVLSGQSLRLSYSKILPDTNTSFSMATYRYSTSGYLGLRDAMLARAMAQGQLRADGLNPLNDVPLGSALPGVLTPAQRAVLQGRQQQLLREQSQRLDRQRSRFELTLNQRFGAGSGELFANASASDYWNRRGTDVQFQVGYNNAWRQLNYSVSAARRRDFAGRDANQYFLNVSLPLGNSPHALSFTASVTRDEAGHTQEQAMLNGSAGVDNEYNYGATVSHDGGGIGNAASVNGGYRSPYAVLNASAGTGSGYSQASLGIAGAMVIHPGGVTFGQPLGDTVGIVVAKNATGARIGNAAGARIDRFGYALVPYLTPYHLNTIELDPQGLPLDVQLDATSAKIAPRAGAVVMLTFKTTHGRSLIVRARLADGAPLPFGAEVFNAQGTPLGVVGQAGQILLRGVDQAGQLTARWQDEAGTPQACKFSYQTSGDTLMATGAPSSCISDPHPLSEPRS